MPKSCIFKIILGGSSGSGKSTFINRGAFYDANDFFHIGVSFKLIECLVNELDSYLLQIWDLKAIERFQCLFSGFCKGAKGALLTFDVSDHQSFKQLENWMNMIQEHSSNIPIVLVGTKCDLNWDVEQEEIEEFMEENEILDVYFSSTRHEDKRDSVLKKLLERICESGIRNFEMRLPENDEDFKEFFTFFSTCPICHRENHLSYIKNFYFSKKPQEIRLKQTLMALMERSVHFKDIYYNEISFGIPCCKCYEKYFDKTPE